MQRLTIIGHVGKDPIEAYTKTGTRSVQFSVATKETYLKNNEKQEKTTWFQCSAWGKTGENILTYVKQGNRIYLEGRINTYEYDKQGQKHFGWNVSVDKVEFLGGHNQQGRNDTVKALKAIDDNSAFGGTKFKSQSDFDFSADDIPF